MKKALPYPRAFIYLNGNHCWVLGWRYRPQVWERRHQRGDWDQPMSKTHYPPQCLQDAHAEAAQHVQDVWDHLGKGRP